MARWSKTPEWLTRHLKPSGQLPAIQFDHEAAIGAAERAGIGGVELRVLAAGGGEAEAQILERRAAPVAVDRVGEGLAVAGASRGNRRSPRHSPARRTPRDSSDRTSHCRSCSAGRHGSARRRAAARRAPGRLDDLAPDRVAIGAGEAETLDVDRIETGQLVGIDRGSAGVAAPRAVEPVEVVGRLQAVQRVERRRRRAAARRCRRCRPG